MELLPGNTFSTILVKESTDTKPPKSELLFNGKPTHSYILGAILECSIKYNGCYLVFMTDDVPYEETLRISLLDSNFAILDYASLAWAYSTGSFKLEGITEPNLVSFQFFGGTIWNIQIYAKKRFLCSLFSEPSGVWRKFGLFHYFKVTGNPKA